MAITLGDAVLWLRADDSKLKNDLSGAESETKSWSGRISGFMTNAFSFAVGGLIQQGLTKITSSIGGIASEMISSNAAFEDYTTRFKVLLGSSEAAQKRMDELAQFGAKTPFELPGVVEADLVIQGFGLHSAEAAKKFGFTGEQIRTIAGDVASGTGQDFKEMATLLGKFSSGATGEAIMRFQELGITTREELGKMGLQFAKSGQLMSPVPEAMNVVLQLMQKKYGGLMDAQSKTFKGMMSNLQDWWGNTVRLVGQPLFEVLKTKLEVLLTFLGSPAVQASIQGMANAMAQGMGMILDFINQNLLPAASSFYELIRMLITGDFRGGIFGLAEDDALILMFFTLRDGALALWDILNNQVLPVLTELGARIWNEVLPAVMSFLQDAVEQLIPGLELLASIVMQVAQFALPYFIQGFNFLIDNINIVLPILGILGVAILALTSPVTLIIAAIVLLATAWANNWGGIQEKTQAVLDFVMPYVNQAMTFIQTTIGQALSYILAWWSAHGENVMALVSMYMNYIWTIIQTVIGLIIVFWNTWGDTIMTVMRVAWENTKIIIRSALDLIGFIIDAAVALMKGDWSGFADALHGIWDTLWNAIVSIITNNKDIVISVLNTFIGVFKGLWQGVVDWMSQKWTAVWDGISNKITSIMDTIKSTITTVMEDVRGLIDLINSIPVIPDIPGGSPSAQSLSLGGSKPSVTNNFNQTIYSSGAPINTFGEFQTMDAMLTA